MGARNRVRTKRPRGDVVEASRCEDSAVISGYLDDVSGRHGEASAIYRPRNEAELAAALRDVAARGEAVTLVAAQTSTTASSVPQGGAVISTERWRQTLSIDPDARRARAETGVLLGDFQRAIEREGFFYPPDPTSRNECTLGGAVACNASGARTFRYGPTRRWVQGLRVMLMCGEVLALRRGEVVAEEGESFEIDRLDGQLIRVALPEYSLPPTGKHAGGYEVGRPLDLIDLFIGSEGTLGVLLEVEVEILRLPEQVVEIFACFTAVECGLRFVERARAGEHDVAPISIEWLDAASLDLLRTQDVGAQLPASARCAVFVEQECAAAEEDVCLERWARVLDACDALDEERGGVVVARDERERETLRAMRHAVPVGVNARAARNGMPKLGTDLAVPDAGMRELLALYERASREPWALLDAAGRAALLAELDAHDPEQAGIPDQLDTVSFGHIGDNHLHVNFLPTSPAGLALARAVYAQLTRRAIALGGTPSAEHGIGKIKHAALRELVGAEGIEGMRRVKRALDPSGCLGRGNLFPLS
jgi:D-lactate dehydrogenase (cytochrome)